MKSHTSILLCAVCAAAVASPHPIIRPHTVPAAVHAPPASQPDRLEVYPSQISLNSRRACRQLVVTGFFGGEPRDLTAEASYTIADTHIARLSGAKVLPVANGRTFLVVRFQGRAVQVPVVAANVSQPDPVQFQFETVAVLTKQGCATGSCHGSPHGKGGFSLSLFGYDPNIDRISLTRDGYNRRVNILDPDESLMLKKPLLELPHVGGKRLRKNFTAYQVIRNWIAEGAHTDLAATTCTGITLYPAAGRVLHAPHLQQQLSLLAGFSDGSARDVSPIATYESSNPAVATVDADGMITGHSRGQAAISVRYLDKLQSVYITVVEDVPGFHWKQPAENNFIDRLVDDKLKQLQYLPSETAPDAVFIRRVFLDLTGLLPTAEDSRQFLADSSPNKRSRLIDRLMSSEEYARFWALKTADLMRVSPNTLKDGRAAIFARWIVDSQRKNVPFDQFVRELLTSTGDSEKNAAANYFLAIPTMEERAEMTSQLFMGTRIECAHCHNHPFENWTMRDYYRISAVFARTQAQNGDIELASAGEAVLPTTHEVMAPWGMTQTEEPPDADRRAIFADWLTKPGNPFFARVEVNRIWAELMGRGIVDPVDDFRSSNPPSNVPLLDALAAEFERTGYDRKQIIRLICSSQAYQRSTLPNPFNSTDETLFSHARARMLTAEQLQDALGMAARVLPPLSTQQTRLADLQSQVTSKTASLETNFPSWLEQRTRETTALDFWQGGWYAAGPFKAAQGETNLTTVQPPDGSAVNLGAQIPGAVRWELRPGFKEGIGQTVGAARREVELFYRRLFTRTARTVAIEINSRDAVDVWLNGQNLTPRSGRGNQKITLPLQAGENHLLLRVAGGSPKSTLTYQLVDPAPKDAPADGSATPDAIPAYDLDFLSIPPERRTSEQQRLLHDLYVQQDPGVRDLQQQIERLNDRMEYATQRPYPQMSAFSAEFGQPKRETACTCERQHSPTLLEALEILNGQLPYQVAQSGAAHYEPLNNDQLVHELYLSALCRQPTAKEESAAKQFLARGPDRHAAITDLIWTVLSTREFLFQH